MDRSARLATAALACTVALLAACGGDDDSATGTTTTVAPTTTTTAAAGTGTTAAGGTPANSAGAVPGAASAVPPPGSLSFVTEDGSVDVDLTGVTCTPGGDESSVTLSGGTGTTVTADAAGGEGTLVLDGSTLFDGTIEDVRLGDAGNLVIEGTGNPARAGAPSTTFTLAGECA